MTIGAAPIGALPIGATPIAPPKVKTLTLCDFRAFAGPDAVSITLNGKNLLIYGENGAGKSSIFHALNEFFSIELADASARQERFAELRNRFSGLSAATGYIEVELDDGGQAARWNHARHPVDIAPTSDARVVNGAFRKAILDYRALLDTNYRHGSSNVNLFDLCVRVLLRDYPVLHRGKEERLFEIWRRLEGYLKRPQLRTQQLSEINALTASFNQGLREALDLLRPKVDTLLTDLGWDDVKLLALTTPGLTYNNAGSRVERAFQGCEVTPELQFRALTIATPQNFLNEARLSALALAIYFAGRQVCATTLQANTPRLMVLDDVLIGLDQSNRLPVLHSLDKHFSDWQIVLLTHDRVWFEMARCHLADRTDWAAMEMFEEKRPDGSAMPITGPVRSLVKPATIDAIADNIATARRFYGMSENAAAAVHARIAFELVLKKVCERKAIPVRFKSDPRQLKSDELLTAIEAWLGDPGRAAMKSRVDPAIASLKLWRKVVLNPFSHSTPVNLTSAEVLGAIDSVETLHSEFKTHIPK